MTDLPEIADLRAITNAAIHYVNCDHEEANTGEPWDALVNAVRVHERNQATALDQAQPLADGLEGQERSEEKEHG